MKTLIFDTCFNKTYIVLRENDNILFSKNIVSTDENYHSAYLIPEIRNILKANNILIKDLDTIGVNIGPGSFTGIRAGITIARVLCQQAELKLVGIESLRILSKLNTTKNNSIVLTDARKNKVYLAVYDCNGNAIIKPKLEEKDKITEYIDKDIFVITDNSIGNYLKELNIQSMQFEENDNDFGLYLSNIVYSELNNTKDDFHWAKVKPLYIQQPSISKPKELKNV